MSRLLTFFTVGLLWGAGLVLMGFIFKAMWFLFMVGWKLL